MKPANHFFAPALTGSLESAFCVAHKFMWINSVRSGTVGRLFGLRVNGIELQDGVAKTFLNNWWVRNREREAPFDRPVPATTQIRSMFLNALCDSWAEALGDKDLRFCEECLEHGHHSFIFQIAALQRCPLHGCELTKKCPNCGAVMSSFSLSRQTFRRACTCTKCEFSWSPEGGMLHRWFETELFHASFQQAAEEVVKWLSTVGRLALPFSGESVQALSYTGLTLNETAYACARASAGPCPFESSGRSEKLWVTGLWAQSERVSGQFLLDLSRNYRAVRRQIERRALVHHRSWIRAFRGVQVIKNSLDPTPEGQFPWIVGAYACWRSYVEENYQSNSAGARNFFSAELLIELQRARVSVNEATYLLLGYFYGLCAVVAKAYLIKFDALSEYQRAQDRADCQVSAYTVYQFRVLDAFRREVLPFMSLHLEPPNHHLRVVPLELAGVGRRIAYLLPSRCWEEKLIEAPVGRRESRRMLSELCGSQP